MAGDQKTAAQKRTEALLAKDPDHFKKLAAKRKGTPNPSSTKFKAGDTRTKILGMKGGENSVLSRFPLQYEALPSEEAIEEKVAEARKVREKKQSEKQSRLSRFRKGKK